MFLRNCLIGFAVVLIPMSQAKADCVAFKAIQSSVKSNWAQKYSGEKVLKIEKSGSSSFYEKLLPKNVKVKYCLQPLKVTVMQSGKEVLFNVSWHYRKAGATFVFDHFAVGESEVASGKGKEGPAKDELIRLITDAYKAKVSSVSAIKEVIITLNKYREAEGRWWYEVECNVRGVNKEGKECTAERSGASVFRGKLGEEGKDPTAKWSIDLSPNGCY